MQPIRLYWWRPKTPGEINLGDEINGAVVAYATGREVVRSSLKRCDLFAIGSVLAIPLKHRIFETRTSPIHVWGSGLLTPIPLDRGRLNYVYHALRGPLTRCMSDAGTGLPVGDPGLLAEHIWPAAREKRHAWGIIAHHSQLDHPAIARLHAETPRSVLIDFTAPDVAATLKLLSECERIASNGLHGLIIADSYRIPSYWFETDISLSRGQPWKFYDYFAAVGRTRFGSLPIASLGDLNAIVTEEADTIHFRSIARVQEALLAARPEL